MPTEDKIDMKDSFWDEQEYVFDKFLQYHTKLLLRDFSAKICSKDILKPTTGNDSLHRICNDTGIRAVNFNTPKNLSKV
jgi:hypothetical protein